jgi:hypothetical protein
MSVKSQFTTNAQNVLHLKTTHSWTRLIIDCHTLSKVPGAVTNALTGTKNVLVNCLFIVKYS